MRWDVFCKVIDNHGDLGVCWRLAVGLAEAGEQVRLWVDDASALSWMAPHGHRGIEVHPWAESAHASPADAVVEAFGCELEPAYQAALAQLARTTGRHPAWINLEYLSAEPWVERCHGLPSPVLAGPAAGLTKHFFYPGFTPATGGLLREGGLPREQADFDRGAWLTAHGIAWRGERLVSLFCYEPPGLPALLSHLAADAAATRLLVTAGRAAAAVRAWLGDRSGTGGLAIDWLPLLPQPEYDRLLWACDLNFVRGEDSLVRALWAGRPLVWNIYPQQDGAHWPKLRAFLDRVGAPESLRAFHEGWNGAGPLPPLAPHAWAGAAASARERLLASPDLVTQLRSFAARVSAPAGRDGAGMRNG